MLSRSLTPKEDSNYSLIRGYLKQQRGKLVKTNKIFEIQKKYLYETLQREINKLIVELETGGNIRF